MKECLAAFLMTLVALVAMAGICGAAEKITDEQLKCLLGKPDVVVIDLRGSGEWEGSLLKVPHAVHEDPADVSSWAATYSKDAVIVLYCS